jgi:hypothetical protein
VRPRFSAGRFAQAFPAKPIKLVIAFPAGGPTDITMRQLADNASKILGQPVIIDNKPGAGGTLPAQALQTAQPDGYTLAQIPLGVFRLGYTTKINWDPLKDISYVINVTGYAFGIVVPADSPFKTWADFVAYAKANPGKLTYGSTGTLTSPHLTTEIVAQKAGIELQHVPYKGSADLMLALVSGQLMAARRQHRLRAAGRGRQAARAQHLGREAPGQVPRRAHAEGAGLRHGAELALRHRRAQGHAARGGEEAARRVQEGDGRAQLRGRAGPLRHAAELHEFGDVHQVRAGHGGAEKVVIDKLGLGEGEVSVRPLFLQGTSLASPAKPVQRPPRLSGLFADRVAKTNTSSASCSARAGSTPAPKISR